VAKPMSIALDKLMTRPTVVPERSSYLRLNPELPAGQEAPQLPIDSPGDAYQILTDEQKGIRAHETIIAKHEDALRDLRELLASDAFRAITEETANKDFAARARFIHDLRAEASGDDGMEILTDEVLAHIEALARKRGK
jgi:hypothetical protein